MSSDSEYDLYKQGQYIQKTSLLENLWTELRKAFIVPVVQWLQLYS